jgi:prenyltransferase beta subunit
MNGYPSARQSKPRCVRVCVRANGTARDEWGEVDTRFSYCALSCCKLIGRMEAINVEKAMEYIARQGAGMCLVLDAR